MEKENKVLIVYTKVDQTTSKNAMPWFELATTCAQ